MDIKLRNSVFSGIIVLALLTIFSVPEANAQNTIAAARAAADGETVTFTGIVTRAKGDFTYLQDDSGDDGASGFTIRQPSGNFSDDVADGTITQGTAITVTGEKSYFSGLNQINDSDLTSYTVDSQGNALPAAQSVTLSDLQGPDGEAYEAELVSVTNLQIVNTNDATFAEEDSDGGVNYDIEDPTQDLSTNPADPVVYRVPNDQDTDVIGEPIPSGTFSFTGIVGQFNFGFSGADTPDEGYQLLAINSSTALPVELATFDGQATGSGIALRWQTLSETNNAGFDVLHRAPRATDFANAGFVSGNGTISETSTYDFFVATEATGTHTFRLRQVDVDGAETLSDPIDVTIGARQPLTVVGPNPARPGADLAVTVRVEATQKVDVGVYNVLGQRVASVFSGSVAPGTDLRRSVDVSTLPSGLYFIRAMGETLRATEKISVVR